MALLSGSIFITASPSDALWLEHGITLILAERRRDGQRFHPPRLLEMQSELHALAETIDRHAAKPNATELVSQNGSSGTMNPVKASELLGISPQMVRRDCASGVLSAVKVRGSWRVDAASVEAHRAERERASA